MSKTTWRQIGGVTVYLVVVTVIASFAYSGWRGERGLGALAEAKAEAIALEARLATVEAERARLENLVSRLSLGNLDLDLLDERARIVLGHARADEVILDPVSR